MMVTSGGLTVFVEESSLVAGMWLFRVSAYMQFLIKVHVAAAYIPAQIFDEFTYSPIKPLSASPTPPETSQTEETTVLESLCVHF